MVHGILLYFYISEHERNSPKNCFAHAENITYTGAEQVVKREASHARCLKEGFDDLRSYRKAENKETVCFIEIKLY